jgi:branched-chain amino acid transport system permease protein
MGVNLPPVQRTFVTEAQLFYYWMLLIALLAFVTTFLVARSRLGVAFHCIRQNEEAANMIGINATRTKIVAFALSAIFPGAAGALYASWVGYIDPSDVFDILISVKAPVMVLLGGVGTVFGPAIGAVVYLVFEELVWRNMLQFHAAILGLIIAALVLFLPSGVGDLLRRRRGQGPR